MARILIVSLILALGAAAFNAGPILASSHVSPVSTSPASAVQESSDADDDVVEVQLVVLGIVLGAVFVLGTGAYVLRRRLGLTAYTPPKDSGHH